MEDDEMMMTRRITLMKLLPFRMLWPLCWNFFIWSIRSVFRALSTSTNRKAVMLTLLYLKSSRSMDSMSWKLSRESPGRLLLLLFRFGGIIDIVISHLGALAGAPQRTRNRCLIRD